MESCAKPQNGTLTVLSLQLTTAVVALTGYWWYLHRMIKASA